MRRALLLLALLHMLESSKGGGEGGGSWTTLPPLPVPLGEVSAGLLQNADGEGVLVVLGEGDDGTFLYNTVAQTWSRGTRRPFRGHHIAAEVVANRLFLLGGLKEGGDKVQIYDLLAGSWTLGADLPFEVGSAASAYLGGLIYLCGGILASTDNTTDACLAYDPAADAWSGGIAPMPLGVNHAAAGTDGERMFVAGGRGGPNRVGPGYDLLQIYDPATNSWDLGAPLPEPRGGMGKAVVHDGRMYVFGGESDQAGPVPEAGLTAYRVYERVDVYHIANDSWSQAAPMSVPRHGIFPVGDGAGRVYLAGGGTRVANSQSTNHTLFEVA